MSRLTVATRARRARTLTASYFRPRTRRPYPVIPSWSENENWEVVYKNGVSVRKSTLYGDKAYDGEGNCPNLPRGYLFTGNPPRPTP